MDQFSSEYLAIIDEYCHTMVQIERAIFINIQSFTQLQKQLLHTQSIAMLYSIWEGFVTRSFQLYIRHINAQAVPYNLLIDSLFVFEMETRFKQFKDYPGKVKNKTRFFYELYEHCQRTDLELTQIVETENNVGFEVLNTLLRLYGLEEFPSCWMTYRHPNPSLQNMLSNLLRYRNGIAHGGDISSEEIVTQDVYNRYRSLIRELMYGMHERFLKGILDQTYMKHDGTHFNRRY